MRMNGIHMVATVIVPQPGANQIEIVDEVYKIGLHQKRSSSRHRNRIWFR